MPVSYRAPSNRSARDLPLHISTSTDMAAASYAGGLALGRGGGGGGGSVSPGGALSSSYSVDLDSLPSTSRDEQHVSAPSPTTYQGESMLSLDEVRAMLAAKKESASATASVRPPKSNTTSSGNSFRPSDDLQWRPPSVRVDFLATASSTPPKHLGPIASATEKILATTNTPSPKQTHKAASPSLKREISLATTATTTASPKSNHSTSPHSKASGASTSAGAAVLALLAMAPTDAANILRTMPPSEAANMLLQMERLCPGHAVRTHFPPTSPSLPPSSPPTSLPPPPSLQAASAVTSPTSTTTSTTITTTHTAMTAEHAAEPAVPAARTLYMDTEVASSQGTGDTWHPVSRSAVALLEKSHKSELALIDAIDKLELQMTGASPLPTQPESPQPPQPPPKATELEVPQKMEQPQEQEQPQLLDGMSDAGFRMLLELGEMTAQERARYLASLTDEQRAELLLELDGPDAPPSNIATKPKVRKTATTKSRKTTTSMRNVNH